MGNYLMKYVNRNTFRSYNENEIPSTPNVMYSEVYREKALIFTKRRSRSPNKSNKILLKKLLLNKKIKLSLKKILIQNYKNFEFQRQQLAQKVK